MNFFQHQDSARKNTTRLVILFLLAVLSLVVLTNLLVMVVFGFINMNSQTFEQGMLLQAFDWDTFLTISAIVVSVIFISSTYKIVSLAGGGARIAEMMNAELIVDGSGDLNKQKALNVVEEMALAAGTPVPPVYLLPEDTINAFAAGYSPGDAVVAVTRGCIDKLSREQLQGVVAHEFSHILNGDMRLNIRLIGILYGILVIGIIGYYILRSGAYSSRSKKGAGGVVLLGAGLAVIGYAGTFFGNLIKSAVSRQREYLADASAVQFTRNPQGIAGALKRIGGKVNGSILQNPNTNEISHTLFSQGITVHLSSLFATHPPLEARIKRIDPHWDGLYDVTDMVEQVAEKKAAEDEQLSRKQALAAAVLASAALEQSTVNERTGNPTAESLQQAQDILSGLPKPLLHAVHEPHGARAVVYFLVLDNNSEIKDKQLQYLMAHADPGVYRELKSMTLKVAELKPEYRLPLIDIALASLRQLSQQQYQLFKKNLAALVEIDSRINLFEWTLQKIVFHHLDAVFEKKPLPKPQNKTLAGAKQSSAILLSVLAWSCKHSDTSQQQAFQAGRLVLGDLAIQLLNRDALSLNKLNQALEQLSRLKPLQKPKLLQACAACILSDQKITAIEHELYRAIASILDCPMPPLSIDSNVQATC